MNKLIVVAVMSCGATLLALSSTRPRLEVVLASPLAFQEQQVYELRITGTAGVKKVLAVPEFTVTGDSPAVRDAAKAMAEVLWDDLDFEKEFTLVSRDAAAKVPAAA